MKKLILLVATALAFEALPVQAQDYLTPHLESMRYRNLLEHQQRMAGAGNTKRRSRKTRVRTTRTPKIVERKIQVRVDGQPLRSAVHPVQRNGNTFVPFRELFTALGATVDYDSQKGIITAKRGTDTMQLSPSSVRPTLKGKRTTLKSANQPFTRNGTLMVPLRFVTEKMGATVTHVQGQNGPYVAIVS